MNYYHYEDGWVDFERTDGSVYSFRWIMFASKLPHYALMHYAAGVKRGVPDVLIFSGHAYPASGGYALDGLEFS